MLSTVQATLQTFQVSQREFPDIHGGHNKANAFRHAFWNLLIAKKCARFSNNTDSVLAWTKKITDWHEEFSPNEKLAEAMDYHNNRIGRDVYEKIGDRKVNDIVEIMKSSLNDAVKVDTVSKMKKYPKQFVYLQD